MVPLGRSKTGRAWGTHTFRRLASVCQPGGLLDRPRVSRYGVTEAAPKCINHLSIRNAHLLPGPFTTTAVRRSRLRRTGEYYDGVSGAACDARAGARGRATSREECADVFCVSRDVREDVARARDDFARVREGARRCSRTSVSLLLSRPCAYARMSGL